jgi:hypothetical protein
MHSITAARSVSDMDCGGGSCLQVDPHWPLHLNKSFSHRIWCVFKGHSGVRKLDIFFYLFHTAVKNYDCTSLEAQVSTPLVARTLSCNVPSRNGDLSLLQSKKNKSWKKDNRLQI